MNEKRGTERMKIVLLADLHGNMVATKAIERELEDIFSAIGQAKN